MILASSHQSVRRVFRASRFVALLAAFFLFSTGAVRGASETNGIVPGLSNAEFIKWVITQGGYLMVIFVLGWSYRRDFARGLLSARLENAQLIEALKTMSAAMASQTETTRAQTTTLTEMGRVIERCRNFQGIAERIKV